MRYVAEASGAVLDTKTATRAWYASYAAAIRAAAAANAADPLLQGPVLSDETIDILNERPATLIAVTNVVYKPLRVITTDAITRLADSIRDKREEPYADSIDEFIKTNAVDPRDFVCWFVDGGYDEDETNLHPDRYLTLLERYVEERKSRIA
jgi:hypothetical protein